MTAGAQAWAQGLEAWGKMLGVDPASKAETRDRRFAAPEWRDNPVFDTIRQTYLALADKMLGSVDEIDGVDEATRHKLKFAVKNFVDAMSPSNFALTNPQVLKRTIDTRGENLLKGLANMLKDIASGQMTQSQAGGLRGRQEPRDDAGQGHPRNSALPADPIHPDHRHGAGDAAGGVPAVDQPLLHPRPHAGKKLRKMVRRPGRVAVHGQLEIGRREHRRRMLWMTMC